jgi:hypothetical protein
LQEKKSDAAQNKALLPPWESLEPYISLQKRKVTGCIMRQTTRKISAGSLSHDAKSSGRFCIMRQTTRRKIGRLEDWKILLCG